MATLSGTYLDLIADGVPAPIDGLLRGAGGPQVESVGDWRAGREAEGVGLTFRSCFGVRCGIPVWCRSGSKS